MRYSLRYKNQEKSNFAVQIFVIPHHTNTGIMDTDFLLTDKLHPVLLTYQKKLIEVDRRVRMFWLGTGNHLAYQQIFASLDKLSRTVPIYHLNWFGKPTTAKKFDYIHATSVLSIMKATNNSAKI